MRPERPPQGDAAGTDTPLFVTQGFIEPNTKPEDMEEYLDNHQGPERGWLGQWDHVRGYDKYVRGIGPSVTDPNYAIEDSLGDWRAQGTWPMTSASYAVGLVSGR